MPSTGNELEQPGLGFEFLEELRAALSPNPLRMRSVPRAVATGSPPIARIKIARIVTRSHPPPHAGCPRGDPGPLPVLTSKRDQSAKTFGLNTGGTIELSKTP